MQPLSTPIAIDARRPQPDRIAAVAALLTAGGVVGIPTDTVYGLAASALDAAAVERIYQIKRRDPSQPLPLLVRDLDQAAALGRDLRPLFFRLAAEFWPGPLTLVIPAAPGLPHGIASDAGAVALRQSAAPIAAALLLATGFPLTATSANRTGQPPARDAETLLAALGRDLDGVVDGGPAAPDQPVSTLLDLTTPAPRLLRAGAVAFDRLRAFW